ncbi:MAG: 5-formyltetrahydrofolate cyclo-ligase [Rickettsiales bacterium]|nr:5-formyltetrahydrofolate cyclo-ligase [Rickettsiales bacterium]
MLENNKSQLRKKYREARNLLSEKKRKLLSREICRNFFANIKIPKNSVIAGYLASENEVDISILLDLFSEQNHKICLPCVVAENKPMVFREYKKGVNLIKNKKYNFLELPENLPEIQPYLIITPLVAFDTAKNRIGQGGGFYDRTFEMLQDYAEFLSVGVAYECQKAPFITAEIKDFRLDAIVTEKEIYL